MVDAIGVEVELAELEVVLVCVVLVCVVGWVLVATSVSLPPPAMYIAVSTISQSYGWSMTPILTVHLSTWEGLSKQQLNL